jgi:hypothetical protein
MELLLAGKLGLCPKTELLLVDDYFYSIREELLTVKEDFDFAKLTYFPS